MASLQAIDTNLAQSKSSVGVIAGSLSDLTSQADAMTSEDMSDIPDRGVGIFSGLEIPTFSA